MTQSGDEGHDESVFGFELMQHSLLYLHLLDVVRKEKGLADSDMELAVHLLEFERRF